MKVEATARKVMKVEMGKMKVATRSLYWAVRCAAAGKKGGRCTSAAAVVGHSCSTCNGGPIDRKQVQ